MDFEKTIAKIRELYSILRDVKPEVNIIFLGHELGQNFPWKITVGSLTESGSTFNNAANNVINRITENIRKNIETKQFEIKKMQDSLSAIN